ncbi:MAG: inositol monophosphatase [Gammaproteobacteria bacterium]|nr:inositol monophosphatase [Gammaproteobacteria bacterium]
MQGPLNIAVRAARAAGDMMVRYFDRVDTLKVAEKAENDFVTEVDERCERIIIDTIAAAYPEHGFLAEESGARAGDENVWVIDPLDGTLNFMHGFPQFCVSIALRNRGRVEVGVIYDPLRQELFVASRGGGARLNDRRIRVSVRRGLKGALIGTGFAFGPDDEFDRYLAVIRGISMRAAGLRRLGAAALDLAYVAAGRLDGFFESGLSEWDIAAGALIAREAGAIVADADGSENYAKSGNIVAAPPRVYKELHGIIGPKFTGRRAPGRT